MSNKIYNKIYHITNNIKGRNKMWMITFTGGYTFIVSLFCWFVNRLFSFFLIRITKVWLDSRIPLNSWKHYYLIFEYDMTLIWLFIAYIWNVVDVHIFNIHCSKKPCVIVALFLFGDIWRKSNKNRGINEISIYKT